MMTTTVDEIKEKANAAFKAKKFVEAEDLYSSALDQAHNSGADGKTLAVLLGNRANACIRLEQYGTAIHDASEALEHNPSYVKAYYRRASAYLALSKYKEARKDYSIILKLLPKDPDATLKLNECEKRIRENAFAKAIESDSLRVRISDNLDPNDFAVDESYTGPRIGDDGVITQEFINDLLDTFRNQKTLHTRYAITIVLAAKKIMDALPNVVELPVSAGEKITVCGDVHGQYYDLANSIFKLNGLPSADNPYVFNGDFVDRGSFSVEVILTLLALKVWCPEAIHLTRGNHESLNMNRIYGFAGEVRAKYTETVFNLFTEMFQSLPLAFILDGSGEDGGKKALIVHGGLFSKDGVTIADIQEVDRNCEPESGLMAEMLWSDPQEANGWGPSKRGMGVAFGPDVTHRFLDSNGLDLVVRSHEMKEEGFEVAADGRLITIFSAPNYCDQMGNKGAFIRFDSKMEPDFVQFSAVPVRCRCWLLLSILLIRIEILTILFFSLHLRSIRTCSPCNTRLAFSGECASGYGRRAFVNSNGTVLKLYNTKYNLLMAPHRFTAVEEDSVKKLISWCVIRGTGDFTVNATQTAQSFVSHSSVLIWRLEETNSRKRPSPPALGRTFESHLVADYYTDPLVSPSS